MLRLRIGLILTALVLSGCDHNHRPGQNHTGPDGAAVAKSDSDLTGEPNKAADSSAQHVYPRATLVALPSDSPPPATNPPPDSSSMASSPPPEENSKAPLPTKPSTPPPDATSVVSTPPDQPPAISVPSNSEPPRLAINTAMPAPAIPTPPATDDATAQEQVVVLKTTLGTIVLELDDAVAPRTCANFRKLVTDGFYDHTVFHRVIPHFMIQGGDPNSKSDDRASFGQGGPGYTLPAEIKLKHERGAVAMARLPDSVNPQRESNGSQFYICVAACPSLDDNYTVFAHVIKGLDIAEKIAGQARDPRDNPLDRIEMFASFQSKNSALQDSSASNP